MREGLPPKEGKDGLELMEQTEELTIVDVNNSVRIYPKCTGNKIHYNAPGAWIYLQRCVPRMIEFAKKRIIGIPDSGYFRDFALCNVDMCKVYFEPVEFSFFVERDLNVDGEAFLGCGAMNHSILLECRSYFTNGRRNMLLDYINRPEFPEELLDTMKIMMENCLEKSL